MTAGDAANGGEGEGAGLHRAVQRLAYAIDRQLGPGEVAELRRMTSGEPGGAAYWRLLADHVDDRLPRGGEARDAAERAWAAILCGMAVTAGFNLRGERSGAALARAGVSEGRLDRLLRASGGRLADEVRAAARIVCSKGIRIDWTELARHVLDEGTDRAEQARRDLARSYYRALRAMAREGKSEA